jgi:hypothetical protein
LIPVVGALVLVAGIRLVVGVAGGAAALVAYPDEPGLAFGFLVGVGLLGVAALYRSRASAHWTGRDAAVEAPVDARRQGWLRTAAQVSFPSTIGLTGLLAIALPLEPVLAAVLSGFLVGMGLAALALAGEQAVWELRTGRALAAEAGESDRLWFWRRQLRGARDRTRIAP